ncbi:MAG: RagB/SusD family nutrient uptake outer membrane protein [Bacteroidales bacterium]|nr:RagB/SusD family nutrient uptake outer membrane protein [Bacteroidales bacterium]
MKTIKVFAVAAICGLLVSCSEDFLKLAPLSSMNENSFYSTAEDFETAMVSVYATLYNEYGPNSSMSMSELMTDECLVYSGKVLSGSGVTTTDIYPFNDYSILPSNTAVRSFWNTGYSDLNRINKTLDKLVETEFGSTATGLQYQGALRFFRALYHFNLVRLFGPIPIVDHSVTVEESYTIGRSPEADVYSFIIDDLTFAKENLPLQSKVSKTGEVSKGAALTCLGEVYLTMGDKAKAATALGEVISSNEYALVDDYADLWDMTKKNGKESILEIQHVAGAGNPSSPYFERYAPFENFYLTAQGGGINQVTDILWDNYEAGDPRRELSVFPGYTNASGTWVDIKFEHKWFDDNFLVNGLYYYGNNFIVYRYADVLLMYAEATGDASYLNMVRARVGLPGFGEAGYPSAQYPSLALAIEHERNVELALEFHRFFDLKRTGRATAVFSAAKGKTITENMLVLPIPQEAIDQNPDVIQQNEYYK